MSSSLPRCHGSPTDFEHWIEEARLGSLDALGKLLEACRPYLLLVGNQAVPDDIRAKVGASDLVQETCLNVQREFHRFTGSTEEELLAWLRQILLNNASNAVRHFRSTQQRQVGREIALGDIEDTLTENKLTETDPSPSAQLVAREKDEELRQALAILPEHYCETILLHHQERLTFEEIGRRQGRSAEAARKIWGRAIQQLQGLLGPVNESE